MYIVGIGLPANNLFKEADIAMGREPLFMNLIETTIGTF